MADIASGNENVIGSGSGVREKLGGGVVYYALSVIAILSFSSVVAVFFPFSGTESVQLKERFGYAKEILTILLPVLGTWVGTVLAFYFSRDNFAAAAKQTSDLVRQLTLDQKLQDISVKDCMISMISTDTLKLVLERPEEEINLKSDIIEPMFDKSGRNRLPFVDVEGRVKYIVHRSMVDKFISVRALSSDGPKPCDLTLKNFLDADQYRQVAANFGTISPDAKLNAVKTIIDGNPDCSDVFVTEDGTKNGKAIGWITNVILAEKCRV